MWDEILRHLPQTPTAVLSGLNPEGYPYSVRCRLVPEPSVGLLRLDLARDTALRSGRASLLCHSHDELLSNQKILVVARFVIGVRRNTTAYLRKRGLARPRIPWEEIVVVRSRLSRDRHLTPDNGWRRRAYDPVLGRHPHRASAT